MAYKDFADLVNAYLPDREREAWRDRQESMQPGSQARASAARSLPIQARIDLHGQTTEQARQSVDRFLKSSATQGLVKVLIIHGKGSGTLRTEIRRFLEGHPLAGSREIAPQAEGGQGALVVLIRKKRQEPD